MGNEDEAGPSLRRHAIERLRALAARGLSRAVRPTLRQDGHRVLREGRELLSFSDNDYLGLSRDKAVCAAAALAVRRHGAGAGASRLVTGGHPLHRALEERLADWKGMEDAVLFGSGYLANIGVPGALMGDSDLILLDALSHACLHQGAHLSRAAVLTFPHNDVAALEALLARERAAYRHVLIASEGVFSMDGDRAPLAALRALADRHQAWLMIDDAHGFGVLGDGRGSVHEAGVRAEIAMGTLSKALGSVGGFVAADREVADLVRQTARSHVYTTGLPPSAAAAALAALDRIRSDPDLTRRPLALARLFAARVGLAEPQSPVVPLVLGRPEAALALQAALEDEGFLVVAIRPPTVPEGTARLRFSFSAAHCEADVLRLADAVLSLRQAA
ncbi:MAG: 8-amino-7-oxononanoate synthase [Rhodothalassiaceae bacterium]